LLNRVPIAAIFILLGLAPPTAALAQMGSPAGPVPPEFLEARRESLLGALAGAPALLSSARERDLETEYFQDSDYREDNDFFYLTGLEAPGAWLALNVGGEGRIVLYVRPRSPRSEQWTGERIGPGEEARAVTGIADVRSTEVMAEDLERWFGPGAPGGGAQAKALHVSLGDDREEEMLGSLFSSGAPVVQSLAPLLGGLRLVKDEEEIRRLRAAAEITMEAHREVWRLAEPGLTEYQAEAALEYVFKAQGAERVGFPSIVGSGPNSVILHYDKSRRRMEAGDLVVVDIGAEYGYYTADITRTFPVSGRFSPRQRAVYGVVLGAWEAALEAIRPGSTMREVNQAAQEFLAENSGDLCGPPSCAPFLIHGVSHWLGMDVHDVGRNQVAFVPGMVLTLEPGLYLSEEALGIRVEDDILVTETGHEVLTGDLPRTADEIEAIMRENPKWVHSRSE
jgi:Xaa-Pro aminopeptidase